MENENVDWNFADNSLKIALCKITKDNEKQRKTKRNFVKRRGRTTRHVGGLGRSECLVPYVGMAKKRNRGTSKYPRTRPPTCVGFCDKCGYILKQYHLDDGNARLLANGCFACVSEDDCMAAREEVERLLEEDTVYFFPERLEHILAMIDASRRVGWRNRYGQGNRG